MKIAQIAPLAESVPPRLYGGTERVVSYLADELVRLGHDVTLFASGESRTAARRVACARSSECSSSWSRGKMISIRSLRCFPITRDEAGRAGWRFECRGNIPVPIGGSCAAGRAFAGRICE